MVKIPKYKLLGEYKEGESVRDVFVVKIKKGISEYVKGYSFTLVLTDSSGKSIDYKYWGGSDEQKVKELYNAIKNDSVMFIIGQTSSYQGKLQIASNEQNPIKILEKGEYEEADFIKKTSKNIDNLILELESYIEKVINPKLKLLLQNIFNGKIKEQFKKHPAAISIHHNWIGGLLEHTLEVLKYCELSKEIFPPLNEDMLITGALLHDIGKLEEMEMTTRIKGTDSGMFSGHILLGSIFMSKEMDKIDLEKSTKEKIIHMIASHHGSLENGSPKEPMFPEAVALYHADEMSSKIAEMLNFIENSKNETEDNFMPKWDRSKPTNIFLR